MIYYALCAGSPIIIIFIEFWKELESEKLADNWHIKYLCDEMQEVGERVFRREPLDHNLIINVSPGESKSSITTIFFPVWCWTCDPTVRIITASYAKDLAIAHSVKSRDLIRSDRFQEVFGESFQVRKDLDAKLTYGNDHGGQRIVASVGSAVTGKHAHIILIDDPLSADEARSEADREAATLWMKSTINTRKVDQSLTPTILVMQRLHEEDPTATALENWDKVDHIRLPADDRYEIHPPELIDNYTLDGDRKVMNPLRKHTKIIKSMEKAMSLTEAAGQLGQDPRPFDGNKLKKGWFKQRFKLSDLEAEAAFFHEKIRWYATIDGAYTKERHNSATGVLIWTISDKRLYLRNYSEMFLEFPELISRLPSFLFANGFDKSCLAYVEPKATGKSLVQTLRKKGGLNIIEDKPDSGTMPSKEARVDNASPYIQGMNLFFMEGVNWEPFIDQCTVFPNGKHTDLLDCLVMAVDKVDISTDWSDWSDLYQ